MVSSRVVNLVAFEGAAVSGAAMTGGSAGPRVGRFLRVPLAEGALAVSPVEPNLIDPGSVQAALRRLAEGLGFRGRRVAVVLPDGLARPLLVDPPRGVVARDFGRYRLLPSLPYPGGEALVEVSLVDDRAVATGLRRSIVQEYEAALRESDMKQERVDLAPLAALEALRRDGPAAASGVDIVLGERTLLLAAYAEGRLRELRTRFRDAGPDEPARLALDVARTSVAAGGPRSPAVRVVGPGARAIVDAWPAPGSAMLGWQGHLPGGAEMAELPWMGAGL